MKNIMRKYVSVFLVLLSLVVSAQENSGIAANRFFYELTFKPKKQNPVTEKVMMILDVVENKSFFRDFTFIASDSLAKKEIEAMQKAGVYKDISKSIKMPKFSYKVIKDYPEMKISYSEGIINGMTPIEIMFKEDVKIVWKVLTENEKVGAYNAQKATTDFGGRKWVAWFSKDIPINDGPYKFYGLPGLIVKIEDEEKDYSWELKGNKKINDFDEYSYLEKIRPGGTGKKVEVNKEKFEKTFKEFKQDPFASVRPQLTPQMLSMTIPGADKTVGEMIKDQEKMLKDFYSSNDNPIELEKK